MKNKENLSSNNFLYIAFFVALFFVLSVFIFYFYNHSIDSMSVDQNKMGQFGDFVGGTLNPILSFLGFLALLYTISIQRKQINDDKKDREKQQFESTFFALLNVHNQALHDFSSLPIQDNTKFDTAIDVEKKWQNYRNKSNLGKTLSDTNYDYNETPLKEITSLETAHKKLVDNVIYYGNYFHILFELLKFIQMNAPIEHEISYSKIAKSTLTNAVLQLLAIYCYKNDEYRFLLEHYSFFENASFNPKFSEDDEFPAVLEAAKFYDKKAFSL